MRSLLEGTLEGNVRLESSGTNNCAKGRTRIVARVKTVLAVDCNTARCVPSMVTGSRLNVGVRTAQIIALNGPSHG